jgi:hypothetical protein
MTEQQTDPTVKGRRGALARIARHARGNVVGYLALFLALGGTAGAATAAYVVNSNADVAPGVIAGSRGPTGSINNIIPSSIGTADFADLSVGRRQLGVNAIDSARIADGSVKAVDLAPGAVTTDRLANGAVSATKLSTDVQRRIDFSTPAPATGFTSYSIQIGPRLRFSAVCGNDAGTAFTQLKFENLDANETATEFTDFIAKDLNFPTPTSYLHTGASPAGHPWFHSFSQQSQGRGLVTFRWAAETVTAMLSWQLTNTTCSLQGEVQRFVA